MRRAVVRCAARLLRFRRFAFSFSFFLSYLIEKLNFACCFFGSCCALSFFDFPNELQKVIRYPLALFRTFAKDAGAATQVKRQGSKKEKKRIQSTK